MNLHQLELFVAVAESGSFSRGAEISLLTQSTVSQHIAALEDELGVRLFDRTGRGAELTAGGTLLLEQARKVLAETATLRRTMSYFAGLEESRLKVGASTVPATYLLPRLLPRLAEKHPGIRLEVLCGDSRGTLERLIAGEIELAVVGSFGENPALDFQPLLSDPLVLVVGAAHPWRQRARVVARDLLELPLVVREEGSGSGGALLEAWHKAGLALDQLPVAARLGSNEAVKEAVVAGFGAAFLSASVVAREVAHGELCVIEVADLQVVRTLWLATRAGLSLSPAAQAFIALLPQ